MCDHKNLAKIDKVWRCRDCGEVFTEKPVVKAKVEEPAEEKPKVTKKTARKGAK